MTPSRLVASSLRAMARQRMRSGFMMLGCLVGVAALTLVVSVGRSAERKILDMVRRTFGPSSILVASGGGLMMGGPRGDAARLTLDDMAAVIAALPEVEAWDPQQSLDGAPLRAGDATTTARVLGASERAPRVWGRGVSLGEAFDAGAVARSERVALVGETVARALFGDGDPLGAEIRVGSVQLRVIGVLEPLGTDAHGMDRDDEIVVPISTLMRRLANVDTIGTAKLLVRDPAQVAEAARELERILRERHGIASGQPSDFKVVTPAEVQAMVGRVQRVLFVFLPLAALVIMIVGGAVAASLMLMAVSDRTAEIGLRRAVGARQRDIALQFLVETVVITVTAGCAGVLVGWGGSVAVASRLGFTGPLSWSAALLGVALSAAVGLVAGVAPARRAARLEPVDALR
jgi:putative ABC transport system permease protein